VKADIGKRPLQRILDGDGGEEAAGAGALFTVAEKEVEMAGGAEIRREDILVAEAGGEELGAIGFGQIEADVSRRGLMARGHHVEPLKGVGLFASARLVEVVGCIGKLRRELRDEFRADFVAAGANAGADGGEKVGRIRMKAGVEFADSFFEDAGEGATPTGVDGGDDLFFRIDEKDRNAIGGLNGDEKTGSLGKRSVPLARFFGSGSEGPDDGRMDLLQGNKREFFSAERGLEFFAVRKDVFTGVPIGKAKVEDFAAVEVGGAARSGAEAVDKPEEF